MSLKRIILDISPLYWSQRKTNCSDTHERRDPWPDFPQIHAPMAGINGDSFSGQAASYVCAGLAFMVLLFVSYLDTFKYRGSEKLRYMSL